MAKARAANRTQRQGKRSSRRRNQRFLWLGAGILVLAASLWFMGQNVQNYLTRQQIGTFVPSLGREHIVVGEPHVPYNSDPPTSGPHAQAAPAGFYDRAIPDENIIHNLEHGYVAISYDCDQLPDCNTVKSELRHLVEGTYKKQQVIALPRTNHDAPIALTAWQRIELLDSYDEAQVSAFVDAWRGHAPENEP